MGQRGESFEEEGKRVAKATYKEPDEDDDVFLSGYNQQATRNSSPESTSSPLSSSATASSLHSSKNNFYSSECQSISSLPSVSSLAGNEKVVVLTSGRKVSRESGHNEGAITLVNSEIKSGQQETKKSKPKTNSFPSRWSF